MQSANLKNLSYLDQYFTKNPLDAAVTPSSTSDLGWEELALETSEELGWNSELFEVEEYEGETQSEDEGLNPEQQRLISALEKIDGQIQKKMESAQDALSGLEMGTGASQQRKHEYQDYQDILDELDRDLELYDAKVKLLEKTGLDPESCIDSSVSQEFSAEVKQMEATADQFGKYLVDQSEYEAGLQDAAADHEAAKNELLDALQYLSGGKDKLFFTAKVGRDGKHIFKYHDDVSERGREIISDLADGFKTQDWSSVTARIESLSGDSIDNTLALVGHVLMEYCPDILAKVPSAVLKTMHEGILRGNSPKDDNIYYIHQDGKYDTPHNHRRRKDMGHVGSSYLSIAEALLGHAHSNELREKPAGDDSAPNDPFAPDFAEPIDAMGPSNGDIEENSENSAA